MATFRVRAVVRPDGNCEYIIQQRVFRFFWYTLKDPYSPMRTWWFTSRESAELRLRIFQHSKQKAKEENRNVR